MDYAEIIAAVLNIPSQLVMELYAQVLNFAIPFFLILILTEAIWAYKRGLTIWNSLDTVSSLSSGITNITKDVLGLTVVIISYDWLRQHFSLLHMNFSVWAVVIAFIGKDFAGYWIHRLQHEINWLWNHHIVHHSSEEFNLPCALRQSISVIFSVYALFYIPLAVLGVPTQVIAIVSPIHLFMQFWYHTRLIDRLGFLEKIIVTPSHHRVHHAINPEYMDKNYGQIFIVWDKLFGTFQAEQETIKPVYGVKRPVNTWNPVWINFQHLFLLAKDAFHSKSLKDKIKIWFMPTGWRPDDVSQKYPVFSLSNPQNQVKYTTPASPFLKVWIWIQLLFTLLLQLYLFNHLRLFSQPELFLYGAFIFLSVISLTEMMNRRYWSWIVEFLRWSFAAFWVTYHGHWFFLDRFIPSGSILLLIFFSLSLAIHLYFCFGDKLSEPIPG